MVNNFSLVLESAISRFTAWLDQAGYTSHDPYDLWGTRYGLFARRLYYQKNPFGLPLIAPIVGIETFCPSLRKLFVKKHRFATADAQLLLAFLNLHNVCSGSTRASRVPADVSSGDNPQFSGSTFDVERSKLDIREAVHRPSTVASEPNSALRPPHSELSDASGQSSALCAPHSALSNPLSRAVALSSDLLATSISGYSGHCWGYPFDWQNNAGLWKRNTPFITATPYCYEAFAKLADATGEGRHLEIAESIARFVFADLNDTPVSSGVRAGHPVSRIRLDCDPSQTEASAGSYGPLDHSQVINASAYRAFVLFDAARRFQRAAGLQPARDEGAPGLRSAGEKNAPNLKLTEQCCPDTPDVSAYEKKAYGNLNFILQSQREDGSWLYALNSPGEAFIDHFHTCFVLKNLFKINQHLRSDAVGQAIRKGYAYYRRELFDDKGLPKSFAIQPRTQLVRLEMYNFAEAITLGSLMREFLPESFAEAQRLAALLIDRYQLRDGHFVTRVFLGGLRHTFPFLRWPQAQLFYALTNLHCALKSDPGTTRASCRAEVIGGRTRVPAGARPGASENCSTVAKS